MGGEVIMGVGGWAGEEGMGRQHVGGCWRYAIDP